MADTSRAAVSLLFILIELLVFLAGLRYYLEFLLRLNLNYPTFFISHPALQLAVEGEHLHNNLMGRGPVMAPVRNTFVSQPGCRVINECGYFRTENFNQAVLWD